MLKWEYVRIGYFSQPSDPHVFIEPTNRVDVAWLTKKFPEAKVEDNKEQHGIRIGGLSIKQGTLKPGQVQYDTLEAYHAVIERYCSAGWEPFASNTSGTYTYGVMDLKRLSDEK